MSTQYNIIIRSSVYHNHERWTMMYDKPASSQSVSYCAAATAIQEIRRRRTLQLPSIFRKTADVGEQLPQQRACSAVPEITQCD